MSFVLSSTDTYPLPVSISTPDLDRPGRFRRQSFDAVFRRLPRSRLAELGEVLSSTPATADSADATVRSLVEEVLVGWRGILDDNGEDVPFSAQLLDELLERHDVIQGILDAFAESVRGEKARKGN